MKAAVIHGPHQLSVETVPDPECGPDEVILKVHRSSICNATDVHIWEGKFPPDVCPPYPHILGHECCGEIVEVGQELRTEFQVGDRFGFWCKMTGAFGEYNAIKPHKLAVTKLSENVSYDEGSLLEIVAGTLRCVYDSGLRVGDNVLVLGQGPTGIVLSQLARLAGASKVSAVDLYENRLAKSKELGIDFVYNLTGKVFDKALQELRNKIGVLDFVIDAMGNHRWKGGNTINLALTLLRPHGRYVVFGHPTEDPPVNMRLLSNNDIIMRGFEPGWEKSRELIRFANQLISTGRVRVKELITHHFTLHDLEKGLIQCRDHPDKTIKVIIDVVES
ncbi:MAG: zinc-binding dehydrogenase [candidate division KSB1 bacterium]|nr:zinc-binding dehydrogenase [candidate division KSB1 bacterium]